MTDEISASDAPVPEDFRCGTVAVVGRPNVGKSTLVNHLVGQKLSITSRKPQTTRHRIKGILTQPGTQFVFVDTPGVQTKHTNALHRAMNRSVISTLAETDVVVMVIEALRFGPADEQVLDRLPAGLQPILAINKVDRVNPRERLLPFLADIGARNRFSALVPISAEKETQLDQLLDEIRMRLPPGPPMYDADDLTDASERFFAAEFIREQLFRLLGDELPYATSVSIESFTLEGTMRRIQAVILVDQDNQKAIVIGHGGDKLKEIGRRARLDLEKLFAGKVFLELWVKVKGGWADDARVLKSLGHEL
jgi:GTP-binding protein Era